AQYVVHCGNLVPMHAVAVRREMSVTCQSASMRGIRDGHARRIELSNRCSRVAEMSDGATSAFVWAMKPPGHLIRIGCVLMEHVFCIYPSFLSGLRRATLPALTSDGAGQKTQRI